MATLDFDTYRDALGEDSIRLEGKEYPLKLLTFKEAAEYRRDVGRTDFNDPDELVAFLDRFAAVAGIPADVLGRLTSAELSEFLGFFSEALRGTSDRHKAARAAATTELDSIS